MENSLLKSENLILDLLRNELVGVYLIQDNYFRYVNTRMAALFGYTKEELCNKMGPIDLTAPEYRPLARREIERRIQNEIQSSQYSFDGIRKDGSRIRVELFGSRTELNGSPALIGMIIDDTERHTNQLRIKEVLAEQTTILENKLVGIVTVQDRKIVWANHAFESMLGYCNGELIGIPTKQLYANNADYQSIGLDYAKIQFGGIVRKQIAFVRKDGKSIWLDISGESLNEETNKSLWIFIDVTERQLAEQNQKRLTRALKLLSDCSTMLIRAENEQILLDNICKLAVETGGYVMAWVGFAENDEAKTVRWVAQSGYEDGYLDSIKVTWSDSDAGRGPAGTSIKSRKVVVNQDCLTNPAMAPWREAAIKRGYRSSIALPLVVKNQVLGVFSTYSAEPFAFSDEEVALLEELANNLSYGIEALRTRVENESTQIALKKESEKNLALLRNASDGIHILDIDGNIIEASSSFCSMLGYRYDEVIGMNASQWDAQLREDKLKEIIRDQFKKQGRSQFETRHRRKDGTIFDVEVSGFPLELDGKPVLFNSSRDITERKTAEKTLRESEERYHLLFDTTIDGALLTTPDGGIMAANPAACEMFQRTEEEIQKVGRNGLVDTTDPRLIMAIEERNRTGRFMGELTLLRKDGTKFPGEVSTAIFKDQDGNTKTSMTIRDITERKQLEEQVRHLAFFDALTKLPNRRLLDDRLSQTMAASKRNARYGAFMFLDLDNFKPLNDKYGHAVGDLLLIEVARRISSCIRETDTAARFGGDEFVVVSSELDVDKAESITQASIVAEKIRSMLAEPYKLTIKKEGSADSMIEHHCTSSIGVVLFNGHEANKADIFKLADIAMYQAKEAGRNLVRFYNSEG